VRRAAEGGSPGRRRLAPEGDRAIRHGTTGVLAALTLPFLSLLVLGFLRAVLLIVFRRRRNLRPALVAGAWVAAVGAVGIVVGLVASYS
jgi:hypothetical protein